MEFRQNEPKFKKSAKERVLVCMLASTRAYELTFPSIKRHVLDELGADLALSLLINEPYDRSNPLWQSAKYRWTSRDRLDMGEVYDEAQEWLCRKYNLAPPDWRVLLDTNGIWMGGIKSPLPQLSRSSILPFCRWMLLRHLQEENVLDRYDRFVITRSDFIWLCPHPPLSILDRESIWVPDGENYDGVNDRHLVVSRVHVVDCLNLVEDILLRPAQLRDEIRDRWWNNEQVFAQHLQRKDLLARVKSFPYVMYTARPKYDKGPTWMWGHYEPTVRHFVKYPHEFRMARAYASVIRSREDWERKEWVSFDPTTVKPPPPSLSRRFRHQCAKIFFRCVTEWHKPDHFRRYMRFTNRQLKRLLAGSRYQLM
jgi:hypothetical protein